MSWRILSADQQANLAELANHLGGLRASLASPAEVDALTGCVFGLSPLFSFHPNLKLVADPLLFERFNEIAFNAGVLEKIGHYEYRRLPAHCTAGTGQLSPSAITAQKRLSSTSTEITITAAIAKNDEVMISVSISI